MHLHCYENYVLMIYLVILVGFKSVLLLSAWNSPLRGKEAAFGQSLILFPFEFRERKCASQTLDDPFCY